MGLKKIGVLALLIGAGFSYVNDSMKGLVAAGVLAAIWIVIGIDEILDELKEWE